MIINEENWVVTCDSLAQKQELFDYAEQKGVPLLPGPVKFDEFSGTAYRDDADLQIGWCDNGRSIYPSGLMSTTGDTCTPVSIEKFKAMCDAYRL